MLAKLLVWDEDRHAAIARAVRALDWYVIEGVATNLPLLRAAVQHPEFAAGNTYTSFLEEHILPTLQAEARPALSEEMLLGAVAYELLQPQTAYVSPWSAGPWRQAGAEVSLTYQYHGVTYEIVASRLPAGDWHLVMGDRTRRIRVEPARGNELIVREDAAVRLYAAWEYEGEIEVRHREQHIKLKRSEPPSIAATGHAGAGGGGPRALTAPLAGVVVKVSVEEGEHVAAHQPLVILEAMKMEHTISAPSSGVVARLHRAAGDRVQAGDILVELEPE
jgi:3-methylcrotonyl-CoA carboxylase alpha subunit